MGYFLQGSLLEVCTCKILCPCWVGEDPDFGDCKTAISWHFDKGIIDEVDVSGLTIGLVCYIPGNVLDGNWRVTMFINDDATDKQAEAIQSVYSGSKGGPVADLVQLIGEVTSVERTSIDFKVVNGKGTLKLGEVAYAELEPYRSATGEVTTLTNSVFSTVPGSPAYVSKASKFKLTSSPLDINLEIEGFNAIQSDFLFDHEATI